MTNQHMRNYRALHRGRSLDLQAPNTFMAQAATASSPQSPTSWRMARPDVFSVRRTTVEDYLQPMVLDTPLDTTTI